MRGFKSFADKTVLEFTPGVSVIVGPNGSGKSNISDAISWVLGEQGPHALRSAQMADVIFAGSPTRQPLGLAEVKMVIDNSAGLIPLPATEIEISRTLYRSGDSEYRLGGRPCRLLDIQELLSDTGMGRALHTIIGQGHLDDVLQARPEERRQFVEEAAGIAKHRRRRERAERKLAGLEVDLNRLNDLVGELRRQLKPLKQQAELAERHEVLTREATDLARKLAAARLRDLYADRDRRRPAWQEAETRQAGARARLGAFDAEIAELDAERTAAEAALTDAESRHAAGSAARSAAESRLRVAIREESRARERLAAASNGAGRLFAVEEELERMQAALAEVQATLATRETELEEAERAFRAAEASRRDAEDERRRLADAAATRRAQAEALQTALAGHSAESGRLAAASREVQTQVSALAAKVEALEADIERLDAETSPIVAEQKRLQAERTELGRTLAGLAAEEKGLLAKQELLEARREELSESAGAAFARRRGDKPIGLLRDLIEAPPQLAAALKSALGVFADAVIYPTDEAALADAMGAAGTGVTLVGMASEEDAAVASALPSLWLPASAGRPLLEAVKVDPRIRSLAATLLNGVYLVNNLAEAAVRHRLYPAARFVTPDGGEVGPSFVRTSSGQDARLDAVRRQVAALERELSGVRRGLREGRQRLAEIEPRLSALEELVAGADAAIRAAADELAAAQGELGSLRREGQMAAERAAAVEASAHQARARLEARGEPLPEPPPLPPVAEAPVNLRVEVEALRRDRHRLEAGVARARHEVQTLAAEDPVAIRSLVCASEAERATAEQELESTALGEEAAATAHREASEGARDAQSRHDAANRSWRAQASAVESLRMEHDHEDRARLDLQRRIEDSERTLREGHRTEPGAALAELSDDDAAEDLQKRADVVARRLGLLGRVNLLATGELESLHERHDFITRELDDVRAARRDLRELIADVDRQLAELFATAFADVAGEFADIFSGLFPGGEGRLALTDPTDLLASGIEIEARPGSKRVKRLSLLSGGERSLAALAFLFAIFKARPSPFYLMDEVEAALDDVNLHRLLQVVKGFASASQVIVVTHQKRTMEMADVLYGVAMGQDGTSRVIAQRLAEVTVG